jgi:glycosyltransferase involved in cell wall biosynthesis
MHCLLISHQVDYSGAPLALLDLAKALQQCGVKVSLWTLRLGPLAEEFRQLGIEVNSQQTRNFDLLIANTVFGAQAVGSLPCTAKRQVAWIHESPTFFRYHPRLAFDHIPISRFDLIAGVAEFQVKALKSKFQSSVVIRFDNVYKPPERSEANKASNHDTNDNIKVALVAGFEPRKGVMRLRELYRLSNGMMSNVAEILCFGMTPEQLRIVLPERLPSGIRATAYGKVPRIVVISQLASCHALLSLSEDEVKPLTILEAAALGVRSIATDIPAHRELALEFSNVTVHEDPLRAVIGLKPYDHYTEAGYQRTVADNDALGRYSWASFLSRTEMLLSMIR